MAACKTIKIAKKLNKIKAFNKLQWSAGEAAGEQGSKVDPRSMAWVQWVGEHPPLHGVDSENTGRESA